MALVRRLVPVLVVVAALGAAAVAAASPSPDAHDRAVAKQLAAKVAQLEKVTATSKATDDRITKSLKRCKGLGKTPGASFAVIFAMLPVLLIDLVNEIKPVMVDLRATLASMHPHASLFQLWLDAQRAGIDQILTLDNHGKKIDYCAAAKVLVAKSTTNAQVEAVLGIPLARIKALFSSRPASGTVTKLNPRMRVFLIAAGVPRTVAVQLTK